MGNITGAMVFQATIPTVDRPPASRRALGVGERNVPSFASALIAFASSAVIFIPMVRRQRLTGRGLLVGGVFYVVYVGLVVAALGGTFG